jgi:plastocyanin
MALRITPTLLICVAGAAVAGGLLALPASDDDAPAAAAVTVAADGSTAATGGVITIRDFAFSAVDVDPGDTVTVRNEDSAAHTVTSTDGTFDTGTIGPGESVTFVAPAAAGSYSFVCAIHTSMTGTLVVG